MVSRATHFAIALERVDESVVDGNEIYEELEQVSNAIAPDQLFDFIHPDHQEFAIATAREFNSSQLTFSPAVKHGDSGKTSLSFFLFLRLLTRQTTCVINPRSYRLHQAIFYRLRCVPPQDL